MSAYGNLKERLDDKEIIILDGAIGTQLQTMGVPLNNVAWAAAALESHPSTVRLMHEKYIAAGVDIITTNTYSSARHNLEPLGLGDKTAELNWRAVMLAREARDACAQPRPVYIAGSISNFGLITGGEDERSLHRYSAPRSAITEAQSRHNLREQAQMLVEAGVDFLIAESTGGNTHRRWLQQACIASGAPTWVGFKTRLTKDDGEARVGYSSDDRFADDFADIMRAGGEVAAMFHSTIEATDASLATMKAQWQGPIAVYPEADRHDYTKTHKDEVNTPVSPESFCAKAQEWASQGVQIIGGCCGIELEHIAPLRARLPSHI